MEFKMFAPGKQVLSTPKIGLIDADFIKYLVISDIVKSIESKTAHIYEDVAIHFTKLRLANITNRFDTTALWYATTSNQWEIVELLKK